MRPLIRLFFRTLRLVIGPFMLLWEQLSAPKGIVRDKVEQTKVNEATKHLALYQFKTCPFCIKVRQSMRRLSLDIELRDAQHDDQHRQALEQGGGEVKVPCLQIREPDGTSMWLYESDAIIDWLEREFDPQRSAAS